jgi:hypothetical protein
MAEPAFATMETAPQEWQEMHARHVLESLFMTAAVVEARDAYSSGHLWRVSQMTKMLAMQMHLNRQVALEYSVSAYLHSIGKIGVPEHILNKPGKLTDEEYAIVKTHPKIARELLSHHPLAPIVLENICHACESPNGLGYPAGSTNAPQGSRLISVCVAYDAMTSARAFRKAMSPKDALDIIKKERGRQFDGDCVDAFVELYSEGEVNSFIGCSEPGISLLECPQCGPTLALPHLFKSGECIACRNCRVEFAIKGSSGHVQVEATGNKATADEITPRADARFIGELVKEIISNWEGSFDWTKG